MYTPEAATSDTALPWVWLFGEVHSTAVAYSTTTKRLLSNHQWAQWVVNLQAVSTELVCPHFTALSGQDRNWTLNFLLNVIKQVRTGQFKLNRIHTCLIYPRTSLEFRTAWHKVMQYSRVRSKGLCLGKNPADMFFTTVMCWWHMCVTCPHTHIFVHEFGGGVSRRSPQIDLILVQWWPMKCGTTTRVCTNRPAAPHWIHVAQSDHVIRKLHNTLAEPRKCCEIHHTVYVAKPR